MHNIFSNKILSLFLAFVMIVSSIISPTAAYAADDSKADLDTYVASLPQLEEVKDSLQKDEIVVAEDMEISTGDSVDFAKDFPKLTFDKEKVKVHFYQAVSKEGKAFKNDVAGEYMATYYVEPASKNPSYVISRKVIVKEKSEEKTEQKTEKKEQKKEEKKEDADESDKKSSKKEEKKEVLPKVSEKAEPKEDKKSESKEEASVMEESISNASVADELSYSMIYFQRHINKDYVNVQNMDFDSVVFPVTVARGHATYNVKKQKNFEVNSNYIAGMNYELPVYDIDKDSDYYVALPNVNLYNKDFSAYDITVIYNNDFGEVISGYHFEDNILYIPKEVVNHPQNENPLFEGTPIAVQLNYAFGGIDSDSEGNADFSKSIPVQILNSTEAVPENRKVKADNIFSSDVIIPDVVKASEGYKADDFAVYVNGMMMPVNPEAWDLVDGDIIIHTPAAVLSNINIAFTGKSKVSAMLNHVKYGFATMVNAGIKVSTKDMRYYKTKEGKFVELTLSGKDDIFVGWRGSYSANVKYVGTAKPGNERDQQALTTLKSISDYEELKNSAYFLYGGNASGRDPSKNDAAWAIQSYCVGGDKTTGNTFTLNEEVYRNNDNTTEKKTIYEWLLWSRTHLEKTIGGWGGGAATYAEGSNAAGTAPGDIKGVKENAESSLSNGTGGSTDFAFKFPTATVGGEDRVLAPGHSSNINIKFSADAFNPPSGKSTFLAMGCTHFEESAVGDAEEDENKRIYISCLDIGTEENGQRYVVLAFTTAVTFYNQEGCAIYKFRVARDISLQKKSANTAITKDNAMYEDLSGAKYAIYASKADAEADKDRIATLETKKDGSTNSVSIAGGTYYVKEVKAPTSGSYALNEEIKAIKVTAGDNEFEMTEVPKSEPVEIVLEKLDSETEDKHPQGNAEFSGAEFTIKYYDSKAKHDSAGTALKTWVFKTDNKGQINLQNPILVSGTLYTNKHGQNVFPIGYYSIEETKAPVGYHLPSTEAKRYQTFDITAKGLEENPESFGAVRDIPEPVKRGGLQLYKIDEETKGTDLEGKPQGDGSLADIKFNIINKSKNKVLVDDKEYAPGEVCKTIVTDANGLAKTGNKDLPYGDYTVVEVAKEGNLANASYLMKNGNSRDVQIREDGVMVTVSDKYENPPVRGDVEIEKLDKETDTRVPMGSATHVGTTFEITNKSKMPVLVDGNWYQPGEVCKTIKVEKEKEVAKTTNRALPYGTYSIKEVAVGEGYLLTDTEERTFEIRTDGEVVSFSKDGEKEPFRNQVKRGDFNFNKVLENPDSENNMGALAYIPFEVISKTTGEKHIIVSDENGQFNSANDWFAHSKNTNGNDAALNEDGTIDESKLNPEAGVWFGMDREGNQAKKVDDSLGALPYDTYVMNELPCSANEGLKLIKNRTFIIRVNERNVFLGTLDDPAEEPEIGTVAVDEQTGDHNGSNDSEKIIDTVTYKNLIPGKEYTMHGELYDKETEEPIVIDGKKVKSSLKFTPEKASGEIQIEFDFPKSALMGKVVVAFETCKLNGKVIAVHEDLEDEAQTVVYPEIETELVDGQTKTHYGFNDSVELIDTVTYKNLKPGTEYVMKGTLMDKATGKPLMDGEKEISAESAFTPEEKDGVVEIKFSVPQGLIAKKSVVAFEKCYEEEMEVAIHTDINDDDQTVGYPSIGTEAKDIQSQGHYGTNASGQLVDIVTYKNLEPNKEYTMRGVLMNKETGKPILDNGKEIVNEKKFTPTEPNGSVEVVLPFTPGLLDGTSVVVFEECFLEEKSKDEPIAEHKDITDENQTVSYPKIATTLVDNKTKDHISTAGKAVTLYDTVVYENLEVGREYTMTGTLMDKKTGNPVKSDGEKVTATLKFTPKKANGSVKLKFVLNTEALKGRTVVAFESLSTLVGEREKKIIVATHEDLKDAAQTVYIPKITTNASDKATGSHKGKATKTVTISDKVTYSNLIPGKKYTMIGTLMDKDTGKKLGNGYTVKKEFVAKKANGSITLTFKVPGSVVKGKKVVVFETCQYKKITVAKHHDIKDKNQTVSFKKTPSKPKDKSKSKDTPSSKSSSSSPSSPVKKVKTGDNMNMFIFLALGILAMGGFAVLMVTNRKKKTS